MSNDDDHRMSDDDDNDEGSVMDLMAAPSLYTRPVYYRQTRKRGKIIKTVSERYLRDDLGFGFYYSSTVGDKNKKMGRSDVDRVHGRPVVIATAQQLLHLLLRQPAAASAVATAATPPLVICDTNVLLHNMDLLEQAHYVHNVMPHLVIPQTALQECRANRMVAYDRTVDLLRSVSSSSTQQQGCCIFFPDPHHVSTATDDSNSNTSCVSPNDANDARIRRVAAWYGRALQGTNVPVILLSDDAAMRQLAVSEQQDDKSSSLLYQAQSVREFVQTVQQQYQHLLPNLNLMDLVAQVGGKEATTTTTTTGHSHDTTTTTTTTTATRTKQLLFPPHLDASLLSRGVQSGLYHRGVLRSTSSTSAWVTIRRGEERVAVTIRGSLDRNRAVDGDVVAVALHPLDQWIGTTAAEEMATTTPNSGAVAGIASDTAEPSLSELNNVPDALAVDRASNNDNGGGDETLLRPTGKVVGILRRNFDNQSGSIFTTATRKGIIDKSSWLEQEEIAAEFEREHPDGTTTCVFFPVNQKIPPVLIRTTQRDRLLGQRILVSLDSWPATSPYPLGHYVRTIGPTGSKDVETQVLLQQYDIPHDPFPAAVLACLPPENYQISITDGSTNRIDLRHLPVLSIDPPGCKDIDDALHCSVLPNGNYQIGVHIADVTHYVKEGSAMDLEAANRSTSTYLVNKRLDMLPGLLTTDLCSLKGNVDRYAFSVLWEVTPEAEIIKVDFHKSLIHSIAALTYQQAQSYIDQPDDPNDIQACAVKRLALLARKFRKRRIDAGALTLASPEVKFVLDSESLNPTDVQSYTLFEANAVVEEFMLLANVTVSKKILRHYPTLSVLRRHPAPNRSMFDGLISKAKTIGLSICIDDSKTLADSLDAAQVASDPYINKLLRILSTRCMSPAQYFCSGEFRPTEWHHYGLAAPVYTHFTSPIRRYADVCVHRLLAAAIGVAPLPTQLSSKSYLHDLCANMNRRHRAAQLAGRASVQLHTLIFFAGDDEQEPQGNDGAAGKEEDAYVLDVQTDKSSEPSFTVMVPRYGIEGRVKLGIRADHPGIERFPDEHRITYKDGDKSLSVKVFDKVRVRIWVRQSQGDQRDLVLDLVEPVGKGAATATGKRSLDSQDQSPNDDSLQKRQRITK